MHKEPKIRAEVGLPCRELKNDTDDKRIGDVYRECPPKERPVQRFAKPVKRFAKTSSRVGTTDRSDGPPAATAKMAR